MFFMNELRSISYFIINITDKSYHILLPVGTSKSHKSMYVSMPVNSVILTLLP